MVSGFVWCMAPISLFNRSRQTGREGVNSCRFFRKSLFKRSSMLGSMYKARRWYEEGVQWMAGMCVPPGEGTRAPVRAGAGAASHFHL